MRFDRFGSGSGRVSNPVTVRFLGGDTCQRSRADRDGGYGIERNGFEFRIGFRRSPRSPTQSGVVVPAASSQDRYQSAVRALPLEKHAERRGLRRCPGDSDRQTRGGTGQVRHGASFGDGGDSLPVSGGMRGVRGARADGAGSREDDPEGLGSGDGVRGGGAAGALHGGGEVERRGGGGGSGGSVVADGAE
ncbi:hypothetical protein Bca101_062408 [Brassica carinata]